MTFMDKNFIKQEFLGIFPKKCPYYAVTVLKLRNGNIEKKAIKVHIIDV